MAYEVSLSSYCNSKTHTLDNAHKNNLMLVIHGPLIFYFSLILLFKRDREGGRRGYGVWKSPFVLVLKWYKKDQVSWIKHTNNGPDLSFYLFFISRCV